MSLISKAWSALGFGLVLTFMCR